MKMNVQILSRELVKPSTPTSPSLKNYKISIIDELSPTMNIPLIVYYPAPNAISVYTHLKDTLAATLKRVYILAGRYVKESRTVDCSDQGAEFVQAQVDIRLTDLIGKLATLKVPLLNSLIPISLGAADEITDPLLAIQVTIFGCGSLAIGVCASHRVADLSTISTFISEWANVSASWGTPVVEPTCPSLDAALFFPGKNVSGIPLGFSKSKEAINVHKVVTKVFHFNNKTISSVKGKASKVQCVFGIIWKALFDVNKAAKNGNSSDFIVNQPVNMRERTVPPLPKDAIGNLYMTSLSKYVSSEKDMDFQDFANILGKSVRSCFEDCAKILSSEEDGQVTLINPFVELNKLLHSKPDLLNFTSWCRYPFYEADFGWGKPIWVSSINMPAGNLVILIDEKEGEGIEAWVNLDESKMSKFEDNPVIIKFTT